MKVNRLNNCHFGYKSSWLVSGGGVAVGVVVLHHAAPPACLLFDFKMQTGHYVAAITRCFGGFNCCELLLVPVHYLIFFLCRMCLFLFFLLCSIVFVSRFLGGYPQNSSTCTSTKLRIRPFSRFQREKQHRRFRMLMNLCIPVHCRGYLHTERSHSTLEDQVGPWGRGHHFGQEAREDLKIREGL